MQRGRLRKKLYRLTYDRPGIHQKALQLSHSIEEVKKLLEGTGREKSRRR